MNEDEEVTIDDWQSLPHIITIVIDPNEMSPKIDLGDIPPQYAYVYLKQAAEALYECIPEPTISYGGEVIYDMSYDSGDEDG